MSRTKTKMSLEEVAILADKALGDEPAGSDEIHDTLVTLLRTSGRNGDELNLALRDIRQIFVGIRAERLRRAS